MDDITCRNYLFRGIPTTLYSGESTVFLDIRDFAARPLVLYPIEKLSVVCYKLLHHYYRIP
jgi:hypothetical protein